MNAVFVWRPCFFRHITKLVQRLARNWQYAACDRGPNQTAYEYNFCDIYKAESRAHAVEKGITLLVLFSSGYFLCLRCLNNQNRIQTQTCSSSGIIITPAVKIIIMLRNCIYPRVSDNTFVSCTRARSNNCLRSQDKEENHCAKEKYLSDFRDIWRLRIYSWRGNYYCWSGCYVFCLVFRGSPTLISTEQRA